MAVSVLLYEMPILIFYINMFKVFQKLHHVLDQSPGDAYVLLCCQQGYSHYTFIEQLTHPMTRKDGERKPRFYMNV